MTFVHVDYNDAYLIFLQYISQSLQLAADYYIFDLQNMVADTGEIFYY